MKTIKNRHLAFEQRRDGRAYLMVSRFTHYMGKIVHSSIRHYELKRLGDIQRIDHIFDTYGGDGVRVTVNSERVMLTEIWSDVDLWEERVKERAWYFNFADLLENTAMYELKLLEARMRRLEVAP